MVFFDSIFLLHFLKVLPAQFESLFHQHHSNRITLRFGLRQWPITVTDHAFAQGWDAFCEHNIVKRHDTLLLRHSGNLIFDVIHFCELQKQVLLPWTVPLPDLLHMNAVASRDKHTIVSISHPHLYHILFLM